MLRLFARSRSLAALAALAVSSASVVLAAAAPASATSGTTVVWQNASYNGAYWIYQPTAGCAVGSCYFQSSMRNLFTPSASGSVTQVTVAAFNEYGPTLAAHGSIEIRTADNYPSDSSTLISQSTGVTVTGNNTEVYTMSPATITAGTSYELIERANDASNEFVVQAGGSGLSGYMYSGNAANGVGTFNSMVGSGIDATVSIGPAPLSASAAVSPASPDGDNGWYVSTPTVTVTCAGGDPALNCPAAAPQADGSHTMQLGTVMNAGGQTAFYLVPALSVDTVGPTATPSVTGTLGDNGWYTSAASVSWQCTDATSGVASCPTDSTVTDHDSMVTGSATDVAGNTTPASLEVKSDTVAPAITGSVVTPAGTDGKYDSAVTVHWTCTDAGSGVSSCPADTTVTGLGDDTVATATVQDAAGNSSAATVSGLVRRPAVIVTPPVVTPPAAKTSVTAYVLHGLPAKFRSGKAILAAGTYHLTVTTTGGQTGAANAPSWLRVVKTNATGSTGKPSVVTGTCHTTTAGAYGCTFVVTKAMRGSFRKFGLQAPDGTVTYKTVYIR